jgi:tripartite-type tricarboxylate transporter receptor subunit TctC
MTTRVIALLAAVLATTPAAAQEAYPSKPVRLVIPFAPSGPADLIARIIGQKLTEEFGKQFYVENHAGAGGNIGTALAARAPADGYTLLINSQALVIKCQPVQIVAL